MGGHMTFLRMRNRNGLDSTETERGRMYGRPVSRDLATPGQTSWSSLLGDLDRMVADYVRPETYGLNPDGTRYEGAAPLTDSPLHQAARATGVDVETVRAVLRYVLEDQR